MEYDFWYDNFLHSRSANGSAVSIAQLPKMHPNTHHYSQDNIYFSHTSYILPKGSPLQVDQIIISLYKVFQCIRNFIVKGTFTNAILWLKCTGILDKVKFDVMNPPIAIPDPTVRHKQPLILRQLAIIMIVLVVGLSIGTFVFFIELCNKPKLRFAIKSAGKTEVMT